MPTPPLVLPNDPNPPPLGGPGNVIPPRATVPPEWQDRSRILRLILDLFDKDPAAAVRVEQFVEGLLAKIAAGK